MADSKKQAILKEELHAMEEDGKVYTIDLADLVMMQMAGNFPEFIKRLPHNGTSEMDLADALALIEETRVGVTTEKLFPSIVQKTIEAQFGDKHAALRELGQNGIDSYSLGDLSKNIVFDVSTTNSHIVLRVRDYGVGMDAQSLVRDLLIPYNSGKEFDLTKIGEHGIGWYSIVDLADLVKVVSRPRDGSEQAVGALVYHDGKWKASILPHASNGFTPRLHQEPSGTEVTAFIDKKGETSLGSIRDFLYQYLGMVDEETATILFRNGEQTERINSLRRLYETAAPIDLAIKGDTQPLIIGVSKRLLEGNTGDGRFSHRDKNLEQLLFTQQGLFIKYDRVPFTKQSIHGQIIKDLMAMGLDFWVDIPQNVMLTKGRNDIIADHHPMVLDTLYRGFENLFLDVLLEDQELLYHQSGKVLESIARLFDRTYTQLAKSWEEGKYPYRQRFIAKWGRYASKTIDVGGFIATKMGSIGYTIGVAVHDSFVDLGKYIRNELPGNLVKAGLYLKERIPEWGRAVGRTARNIAPPLAVILGGTAAVGYTGLKAYELWGDTFVNTLTGIASAGAIGGTSYGLYKKWPALTDGARAAWKDMKTLYIAIKEAIKEIDWSASWEETKKLWSDRGEIARDLYMSILNRFGLYVDVEEKRKRKREKKIRKISRKYLSGMEEDEFLRRIMHKKIIPADFYYSFARYSREKWVKSPEERKPSLLERAVNTWISVADALIPPTPSQYQEGNYYQPREAVKVIAPPTELQKVKMKISIDTLVLAYLEGKLNYDDPQAYWQPKPKEGDYQVDYQNPIVHTVIDKLASTKADVAHLHDVKVLEDYLDNIAGFTRGTFAFLYFLTPVGAAHLMINETLKARGKGQIMPFSDTGMYSFLANFYHKRKEAISLWYEQQRGTGNSRLENMLSTGVNVGKAIGRSSWNVAKLPFEGIYHLGRLAGKYVALPVARRLDPRLYPDYLVWCLDKGRDIGDWAKTKKENFHHLAEKKRKELEVQRKMDEEIGEIPLWDRVRDTFSTLYRRAFVNRMITDITFDNVGKKHLEDINQLSGAGGSYVTFVKVVEGIDELISKTLDERRFKAVLAYTQEVFNSNKNSMAVDKKGRVHVDLRHLGSMAEELILPTEQDLISVGYTLLDELLHQRTHYVEKEFKHRQRSGGSVHPASFYEKKTELRHQVVDYMFQNGITLPRYMAQFLPREDEIGQFYHAGISALRKHLVMTPRQLRYERLKYQQVIDGSADDEELREKQSELYYTTKLAEKKAGRIK